MPQHLQRIANQPQFDGLSPGAYYINEQDGLKYQKPGGQISRPVGLVTRGATPVAATALAGGALGLLGGPAAPITVPAGAALGAFAIPIADALTSIFNAATNKGVALPSSVVEGWMTRLGYPSPETTGERMMQAGGAALGNVATTIPAAARLAATATTPVVRGIAETVAGAPARQAGAAPLSAATSQYVTERTDSPLLGVGAGIVTGAPFATGRTVGQPPTSRAQVRAQSRAAYNAAEVAGVRVERGHLRRAVNDIDIAITNDRYDAGLHPKAFAVMSRLTREASDFDDPNISLEQLEILRRVAGGAAKSLDPDEARIGAMIIDGIDDFVNGITPEMVVTGDPLRAVAALRSARTLWSQQSRAATIEDAMERARNQAPQFSQSGMENALRVQFRQIANNPRRMKQFTKAEQAQIKVIVRGGPIQNIFRFIGKFAPKGMWSAGSTIGLPAAAGFAVGGPPGAALAAGTTSTVTLGAHWLATKWGLANVQALNRLILRGGVPSEWMVHPSVLARGPVAAAEQQDPNQRLARPVFPVSQ